MMYRVYRAKSTVQNRADESCNVTIIKYNYIRDSLSLTFHLIVVYQKNIFPTMYT